MHIECEGNDAIASRLPDSAPVAADRETCAEANRDHRRADTVAGHHTPTLPCISRLRRKGGSCCTLLGAELRFCMTMCRCEPMRA